MVGFGDAASGAAVYEVSEGLSVWRAVRLDTGRTLVAGRPRRAASADYPGLQREPGVAGPVAATGSAPAGASRAGSGCRLAPVGLLAAGRGAVAGVPASWVERPGAPPADAGCHAAVTASLPLREPIADRPEDSGDIIHAGMPPTVTACPSLGGQAARGPYASLPPAGKRRSRPGGCK